MKWLVTVEVQTKLARLREVLDEKGATLSEDAAAIPMEGGEVVVQVEGPEDLPERMKDVPEVKGVYPSSEMTLY